MDRFFWLSILGSWACGTEPPSLHGVCEAPRTERDAPAPPHCDRFLPFSIGARWTYRKTAPGSGALLTIKELSIEAFEEVPRCEAVYALGAKPMAFRMRRSEEYGFTLRWQSQRPYPDGKVEVYWERDENFCRSGMDPGCRDESRFYREICYHDRHRLYEDGSRPDFLERHREVGMNFGTSFDRMAPIDETIDQIWHVVNDDATITVPAGTFEHVLVLSRTFTATPSYTKEYWFARGVGKVYEDSPPEEREELIDWYIP
jgi:hypothetical protein